MSQKPFTIEYAKSGRALCKKCKLNIGDKSLRIAYNTKSPFHDGIVPNWHHFSCVFKTKHIPTSLDDIEGYSSIKWDDQEKLNKLIQSSASEPVANIEVTIDYSTNSRNKCRLCSQKLEKDQIKIGITKFPPTDVFLHESCWDSQCTGIPSSMTKCVTFNKDKDEPCPACQQPITKGSNCKQYSQVHNAKTTIHMECFKLLLIANQFTFSSISGIDDLEDEDVQLLKKTIPALFDPKIKQDTPQKQATKYHPLLKEQSDEYWKIRKLLEEYSKDGLNDLMKVNNIFYERVSNSIKLDSLADAIVFGLPNKCPVCKKGTLAFESDTFQCHGNINEWTPCFYKTLLPERSALSFPDGSDWDEDFKEYKNKKSKIRSRLFKRELPKELVDKRPYEIIFAENITQKVKDKYDDNDHLKFVEDQTVADFCVATQLDPTDSVQLAMLKIHKSILDIEYLDNTDKSIQEYCMLYMPEEKAAEMEEEEADNGNVQTIETLQLTAGGAIDADSGYTAKNAELIIVDNNPYNSTMTFTDVTTGKNTFYKIQLIKPQYGGFIVFRKYGRIGTSQGGQVVNNYSNRNDAIQAFEEIFLEKTGNQWGTKTLVKKPGMFFPIELDYGGIEKTVNNNIKCNLPLPVQGLLKRIFDVDMLKGTLAELKIDLNKMPLGKISKSQISEAYQVLSDLDKVINTEIVEEGTKKRRKLEGFTDVEKQAKILEYTNKFYHLIPQVFKTQKIPQIDTTELIQEKIKLLDVLRDIEVANTLMEIKNDEISVLDSYYLGLNSDIEVIEHDDEIFKKIEKYLKNTHGETHQFKLKLTNLYRVIRNTEKGDFKVKLHNHKLLWHGTRTSNIASILATGLRIAPPEAPVNGYMFGKGVYFADMVSKSAGYCYPVNNKGYLFLCDVALGDLYKLTSAKYIEKLPSGFHATHGQGGTIPDYTKMEEVDGVEFPVGKPKKSDVSGVYLLYNEFIVYNIGQIKIKYLLDVDFEYGSSRW